MKNTTKKSLAKCLSPIEIASADAFYITEEIREEMEANARIDAERLRNDVDHAKHSPAPWNLHVGENGEGNISASTRCAGPGHIATIYGAGGKERGANARLIAAAPELLAELKKLMLLLEIEFGDKQSIGLQSMALAIGKAEGKTDREVFSEIEEEAKKYK